MTRRRRPAAGSGLIEAVAAVAVGALLAAAAVPALGALRERARLAAGARQVAVAFRAARAQALARGRSTGVLFTRAGAGYVVRLHEDSDGDGLRMSDITSGADRPAGPSWRLDDVAPGLDFGFLPRASIPKIPPQTGNISNTSDPIQFGSLDLVSFSPLGRCTSGTAYLTDGTGQMAAVVLYGPTARARTWRYDDVQDQWVP